MKYEWEGIVFGARDLLNDFESMVQSKSRIEREKQIWEFAVVNVFRNQVNGTQH